MRARVLSALVMVPAALFVVWIGGAVFVAFIAFAALLVGREWARLCTTSRASNHGIALGACLATAVLLSALDAYFAAFAVTALGGIVVALFGRYPLRVARGSQLPEEGKADWASSLWVAAGVAYLGIPCVALVWLRTDLPDGGVQLLWLLLVVWVTDIGAFAVGRTIGGPKLAPRISPGKTWAGFIGALCLCILFGGTSAFIDPSWNPVWLAILAAGLSFLAQMGDLGESSAKRRFGVKDSGRLIPGHGGVLDRVDGLLAASAGYAAVCVLTSGSALTWQS